MAFLRSPFAGDPPPSLKDGRALIRVPDMGDYEQWAALRAQGRQVTEYHTTGPDDATRYAAAALGREGLAGSLAPGAAGDLLVLDASDYRTLCYHFGTSHTRMVVKGGTPVFENRRR